MQASESAPLLGASHRQHFKTLLDASESVRQAQQTMQQHIHSLGTCIAKQRETVKTLQQLLERPATRARTARTGSASRASAAPGSASQGRRRTVQSMLSLSRRLLHTQQALLRHLKKAEAHLEALRLDYLDLLEECRRELPPELNDPREPFGSSTDESARPWPIDQSSDAGASSPEAPYPTSKLGEEIAPNEPASSGIEPLLDVQKRPMEWSELPTLHEPAPLESPRILREILSASRDEGTRSLPATHSEQAAEQPHPDSAQMKLREWEETRDLAFEVLRDVQHEIRKVDSELVKERKRRMPLGRLLPEELKHLQAKEKLLSGLRETESELLDDLRKLDELHEEMLSNQKSGRIPGEAIAETNQEEAKMKPVGMNQYSPSVRDSRASGAPSRQTTSSSAAAASGPRPGRSDARGVDTQRGSAVTASAFSRDDSPESLTEMKEGLLQQLSATRETVEGMLRGMGRKIEALESARAGLQAQRSVQKLSKQEKGMLKLTEKQIEVFRQTESDLRAELLDVRQQVRELDSLDPSDFQ
ncbi:MAG: hypothetical protein ACRYG5_06285 [Janthinobacterium lividum]